MRSIPEKDWKVLRSLKDAKLALFCDGVFEKVGKLMEEKAEGSHQAYLALWGLLRDEDEKMGEMFDDLKRSNAIRKLAAWRHYGMLSDEELLQFSEDTRSSLVSLSEL